MRFLRGKAGTRGTESEAVELAPSPEMAPGKGRTPGKGRPTPTRREAEGRRRGPAPPPPRTQREALRRMRGSKEERRTATAERRARMMAGDEKYLMPRDRGPVKAYARDIVDSRRSILGAFMPLAVLVLVVLFIPSPALQQYVSLICMAMLLLMIFEGFLLGRLVNFRVRARYPDAKESRFGLGWYAFTRATQLRRLRVPRPRVGYGRGALRLGADTAD